MKFNKVVSQINERAMGHRELFEFFTKNNGTGEDLFVKPSGSNVALTFDKWVKQDPTRLKAANMFVNKSLEINKQLDYNSIYKSIKRIYKLNDKRQDITIVKDSETGDVEDVIISDKSELAQASKDAKFDRDLGLKR